LIIKDEAITYKYIPHGFKEI